MAEFDKIAVINTGWSEDYRGAEVRGNFGYLSTGVGHERFNFLPDDDGTFYGYAPPLGEAFSPPKPALPKGWLVFFVSKRPSRSGLYLVGWFEDATFEQAYKDRPDADQFGLDSDGGHYGYTVSSKDAVAVPLASRDMKVRGDHLKRSYAYLRGGPDSEKWRNKLATELLEFRSHHLKRISATESQTEEPALTFVRDTKRRKLIEEAAILAATNHFPTWKCDSKEAEKCGYDLLFTDRQTGEVMHIEVKGTTMDAPCFFLTEKERAYAEKMSRNDTRARRSRAGNWRPVWRLAVVSNALTNPTVHIYRFDEMKREFELAPYAWRGTLKDKS
jgi:hypothetical protein